MSTENGRLAPLTKKLDKHGFDLLGAYSYKTTALVHLFCYHPLIPPKFARRRPCPFSPHLTPATCRLAHAAAVLSVCTSALGIACASTR